MCLILSRHLADGITFQVNTDKRPMLFHGPIGAEFPPGDFEYYFPPGWPTLMQVRNALCAVGMSNWSDKQLEWMYNMATSSFLNTLMIKHDAT